MRGGARAIAAFTISALIATLSPSMSPATTLTAEPGMKSIATTYRITACVNKKTNAIRVVVLPKKCTSKERAVQLSTSTQAPTTAI